MKHLGSLVAVLAIALLFGGLLPGDEKKPTKTRGQLPAGWKKLDLTASQKEQIYKISADYREKISALRKQIADLEEKRRGEMFQVLTAKQKAKLAGLPEEPKGKTTKPVAKEKVEVKDKK